MHKSTRLLPFMRRAMYGAWCNGQSISSLGKEYKVSRVTVYKVLKRARLKEFCNRTSGNHRFRTIQYGLVHLQKAEQRIQKRLDRLAIRRYEKHSPGEMEHVDTKRLPLLVGEAIRDKREHLHVVIDDYSRYLVADIFPDKGQYSAAMHLQEVLDTAPFAVESVYSDNGSAYKGRPDHAFVALCKKKGITQGFTRTHRPQTNGKAERVIRTLMEEWHTKGAFKTRQQRRESLQAFVHYYNTQRPHTALNGLTPLERITRYDPAPTVNNP